MGESIKTYKGFNKDMTCRGFQYEKGKQYEEESVEVCDHGFHACEYPLDCLNYYFPNESVYHEVEQSGEIQKHNEDTMEHPRKPETKEHRRQPDTREHRRQKTKMRSLLLGVTNQKQRAFLGHFLFLQTGNTLVQKIIRNMTEITRVHGFLTVQRWCRLMGKISSRILGIRLKMEKLRRYQNELHKSKISKPEPVIYICYIRRCKSLRHGFKCQKRKADSYG